MEEKKEEKVEEQKISVKTKNKEKVVETASSYVEKTSKLLSQEHKEEVESLETQLKTLSKKVCFLLKESEVDTRKCRTNNLFDLRNWRKEG